MSAMRLMTFIVLAFGPSSIFALSAGDVFIRFTETHLKEGNLRSTMGVDWVGLIKRYTEEWTAQEAQEFLEILTNRIGVDGTIKRIKRPSYFEFMRLEVFKELLDVYDDFRGFERNSVEQVEGNIRTLEQEVLEDFGRFFDLVEGNIRVLEQEVSEEVARKIMEESSHGLTWANPFQLERKVEYLKKYFGWFHSKSAQDSVAHIITNYFEVLATIDLFEFKRIIEGQEKYLGKNNPREEKVIVRRIVLHHFPKIATIIPTQLRTIEGLLERAKGREATINFVANNFDRIVDLDAEILEENMNIIEESLGKQSLQRISWGHLLELANADSEKLREDLAFVKEKRDIRTRRNLARGFSLEKLRYLRTGIRKTQSPKTPVNDCVQLTFDSIG